MLLGVVADRSGIELTSKAGKRASRGPARRARREPLEEAKGQIDYMLLGGLPSPTPNDGFKRGQNFADLHSVVVNRTEGLRAPESVLRGWVSAQPLNPFDQLLCGLLDISKESIMIGGEGLFLALSSGRAPSMALLNQAAAFLSDKGTPASRKSSRIPSSAKAHLSANPPIPSRTPYVSLLGNHTLPAPELGRETVKLLGSDDF